MAIRQGGVNQMVCLPQELKTWIAEQAKTHWTSQNAEIIRCIRVAKDQQPEKAVG